MAFSPAFRISYSFSSATRFAVLFVVALGSPMSLRGEFLIFGFRHIVGCGWLFYFFFFWLGVFR
jgi:hypothetical protein